MIKSIINRVIDRLNSGAWVFPFIAERRYVPVFDLGDFLDLKVSVAPKTYKKYREARNKNKEEIEIMIGVQKKLIEDENEETDNLVDLCESIAVSFQDLLFVNMQCIECQYDHLYGYEFFQQQRQFTGVITLKFIGFKTI